MSTPAKQTVDKRGSGRRIATPRQRARLLNSLATTTVNTKSLLNHQHGWLMITSCTCHQIRQCRRMRPIRPICLKESASKLCASIILARLTGGMSETQHVHSASMGGPLKKSHLPQTTKGFRKGRPTRYNPFALRTNYFGNFGNRIGRGEQRTVTLLDLH